MTEVPFEQQWLMLGQGLLDDSATILARLSSVVAPETLYHFTTVNGLLAVLESQCLWATHAMHFNDSSELRFLGEIAAEVATDSQSLATSSVARAFMRWVSRGVGSLPGFDTDLGSSLGLHRNVFVASLSQSWDVLSQWRAYSADGAGYAIGFEGGSEWRVESETNAAETRARLLKVIYDRRQQADLIRPLIEKVVVALNGCPDTSESIDQVSFLVSGAFAWALEQMSIVCKNPGFSEEQEWRLVVSDPFAHDDICYRPGRIGLTPYVRLRTGEKLSLREVAIGPRLQSFESRRATIDYVGRKFKETSLTEVESIRLSAVEAGRVPPILIRTSRISYR